MGKLQVIVGGQYGSEAKGAVAGWLAAKIREPNLMAIRVGGPNAGHTVYDQMGERWALRQVPVAAVTNPDAQLRISAGSEIDPPVMYREVRDLNVADRFAIDEQATVIEDEHKEAEAGLTKRIGSTGKGIGAARADRIMRTAGTWGMAGWSTPEHLRPIKGRNVAAEATDALANDETVQIEAAQGYGLGLHMGHYPYCTSDDCRAIDALAKVGLSPWSTLVDELEVWIVFRNYPIRVAGDSGPLYGETSWEALGLEPEFTTVTNKMRRVGQWDQSLAMNAIAANGGWSPSVHIALMMLDQVHPEIEGVTEPGRLSHESIDTIVRLQDRLRKRIELVGTSPQTIVDLRPEAFNR